MDIPCRLFECAAAGAVPLNRPRTMSHRRTPPSDPATGPRHRTPPSDPATKSPFRISPPRLSLSRLPAAPAYDSSKSDTDNLFGSSSTSSHSPVRDKERGEASAPALRCGTTTSVIEAVSLLFSPLPQTDQAELASHMAFMKRREALLRKRGFAARATSAWCDKTKG